MALGLNSATFNMGLSNYLPLNRQLVQGKPRGIRQLDDQQQTRHRFTPAQLQQLLYNLPNTIDGKQHEETRQQQQQQQHEETRQPSTTNRPITTRRMTTTSTTNKPVLRRSKPVFQRRVANFNWGSLDEQKSSTIDVEESGVAFLVGMFNLFAVVVYASYRHVSSTGELSDRMINWQVQKVLDELVLRVHSSDYASQLLSRSLPSYGSNSATTRSFSNDNPLQWIQSRIADAMHNDKNHKGLQQWLTDGKERLMSEVAGSEVARKTVRLNPVIYKPMMKLYAELTKKTSLNGSRAMSTPWVDKIGAAVVEMGQLSLEQIQSVLATIASMDQQTNGQKDMLATLAKVITTSIDEKHSIKKRNIISRTQNSLAAALASSLTHAYAKVHNNNNNELRDHRSSRPVNLPAGYVDWNRNDRRGINSRFSRFTGPKLQHRMVTVEDRDWKSNSRPSTYRMSEMEKNANMKKPSNKLQQRFGLAKNSGTETKQKQQGYWTDQWFSLLTTAAPVGLDMTTLYARARAHPACLRPLLCRANSHWKRVGPLHSALTPFLSVVASWALEDAVPHSLGDSLLAVRAGWMGRDCSTLYSECPFHPAPHPVAKEAATFLNRLEHAATQRPPSVLTKSTLEREQKTEAVIYTDEVDRIDSQQITLHQNDIRTNAATLNAFYNRYGGEGPMMVPGNEFHSYNNKHRGTGKDKQIVPERTIQQHQQELPYDRYDSPVGSNEAEGSISGSNSVAGMALQDRYNPVANLKPKESHLVSAPQTEWNHFFKTGLYGSNVPQGSHKLPQQPTSTQTKLTNHYQTRPSKPVRPTYSYKKKTSQNKIGVYDQKRPVFRMDRDNYKSKRPQQHTGYSNDWYKNQKHNKPVYSIETKPKSEYHPNRRIPGYPSLSNDKPDGKYKYGLRRGLPAGNVNGYNSYTESENKLYHEQPKRWHSYTPGYKFSTNRPTTQFTTRRTTTTTTTEHPLNKKDIDPFGPSDAVTDPLRNELLYEYVRDSQASVPIENRRSLY